MSLSQNIKVKIISLVYNLLTLKTFFIITGSISLALGLYFAFESNRVISDKTNRFKRGEQEPLIKEVLDRVEDGLKADKSDNYYYWGLGLTLLGIILNTVGSLM